MSIQISATAATVREQARQHDGKFGEQAYGRAGSVDLAPGDGERTMLEERVNMVRAALTDPRTGAMTQQRVLPEIDDAETLQEERDLLAVPLTDLEDHELAAIAEDYGDEPLDATDAQIAMYEQRLQHEAGGGIVLKKSDGSVTWVDDERFPYRATDDPCGAPAIFEPNGLPRAWYRGNSLMRRQSVSGERSEFEPVGHVLDAFPKVSQHLDGAFEFRAASSNPAHPFTLHKVGGPATADGEEISWRVQGELSRPVEEGPVRLRYDGSMLFEAKLSEELEEKYAVRETGREGSGSWYVRTDAGPAESYDEMPYDYAGSSVDPGFWVGTDRAAPDVMTLDWSDTDG